MRSRQQGLSLSGVIVGLAVVGFLGVMAAKLLPAYTEYYAIRKVFAAMESAGDLKGTVREIRGSFERRAVIDDIRSVRPEDLEIGKEAGETVVSASWSMKVHMVGNLSACLDFTATTAQ
jgi:hypothetical protein